MKFLVLVQLFIAIGLEGVAAQSSSLSSTDWEFQQVLASLIERENRVKSLNANLQLKVNASIADLKPNGALALTVTALQNLRDLLVNLQTVSSYGSNDTTLTCDDIALRISKISFDIQKCLNIKVQVDVNATLLLAQWGSLNVANVANYVFMTDTQRRDIQTILTTLYILVDEYNQYSLTLLAATYKYSRLYIELMFCKKTFCACPTQLSSEAVSAMTSADNDIKQVLTLLDKSESNIRNISNIIINKIAAINPDLKKNSLLLALTTTLDAISILLAGYLKITTFATVNSTTTCDDAAMKVALIEYKIELYFQTAIEAAKNASFALYQFNNLNGYYGAFSLQLTSAQKQAVESIIAALRSLIDEFAQYVINLNLAVNKLLQSFLVAKSAMMSSCNCTSTANGTTIATLKSKFVWFTLFKKLM